MSETPRYHPAEDLEVLWSEFRYQISADPSVELRTIWGRVLQLGDGVSVPLLYPWLTDVRRLVETVRVSIESTPAVPAATILKQYVHVEAVLCEWRLNRGAAEFTNYMTEPVADAMHNAVHTLRFSAAHESVSHDEIASLEAHIQRLAERINADTSLSPDLRRVLLLCLERMRHAIARHRIAGAQAFTDAWKECAGEVAFVGGAAPEVSGDLILDFNSLMREIKALGIRATPAGMLALASYTNTLFDIAKHAHDVTHFLGIGK